MKKFNKLTFLILVLCISIFLISGKDHHGKKDYWKSYTKTIDGKDTEYYYFIQKSVKDIDFKTGTMKTKVERKWHKIKTVNLPEGFLTWSFERRIATIEGIKKMSMPELAGPHNAMVASHGVTRKDSMYSINNAVKGVGFLPKPEKIKGVIEHLKETKDSPMEEKLDYLISMYKQGEELFDTDKQVSLELYSRPEFETHTFLNCMEDPGVALVFLDIPSYELRCIAYMIHPDNPNLTDYEKDVVRYINLIHSYFHGEFPQDYIAVIYFVVEVFDNSPGRKNAMGKKIVPKLP